MNNIQGAVVGSIPTEFEQRSLAVAVDRLSDESESSKRLAMDNISDLARQFPDIEYGLAKKIAEFLLSRHELETSLNIEKNKES